MLKALELFGFKSFADRTAFDFAPGITGVVGPNGSGKSNVVDAIKWILGDQSPKSLRGKEMTDVIFNGSTSRKAAGFAEALLTFDNRQRILRLDADEVVIGRRIYRSGEAEYLINRIPARLKDIKDLFLGTGAGTAAYSIIEQGRVDQLLQASNTARRTVFEEAAGISRFKVRKVDAERKLERVAQNLLRLTDIVKEVETQLNTTRSQASKAAKYREYTQELRALRAGSAADDHRELTDRLVHLQLERERWTAQVETVRAEALAVEEQQRSYQGELTVAEDRLRGAERAEGEHRELVARHEATLRHQAMRLQELDGEYQRLDEQQRELAQRAQQVAGELEQTVADLSAFGGEVERRQQAIDLAAQEAAEASARLARLREERESRQTSILAAVRQISAVNSRAAAQTAQCDQRTRALDELRAQRDAATARWEEVAADYAHRKQVLEAAVEALAQLRTRQQQSQARRGVLQADQAELLQAISAAREQRASLLARRTLLEEFERRQDGVGVGVREILGLAAQGSGPPWNHVLGHVIDLVECEIDNAALVEVALGSRAHFVVLDDVGPLLSSLRSGNCRISGRVGFLVLPQPGGDDTARLESQTERNSIDLAQYAGVVCRADALVRTNNAIPGLAAHLLADTWVVRSLEVATQLLPVTGSRCRFVTLQGELLEGNGNLTMGSLAGESTTISRKSELRTIRSELLKADRQIATSEQGLARVQAEQAALAGDESQLQFDADLAAHHLSEQRSGFSAAELELQRAQQVLAHMDSEESRLVSQLEELRPSAEAAARELAEAEAEQERLQAELQEFDRQLAGCEEASRETRERHARELRDLTRFEERLQNLQQSRSRLDQERFQRDLQHDEAERRFQSLAARREQIEAEVIRTEHALGELQAHQAELAEATTVARQAQEVARGRRGELADRDLTLRHELRTAQEALHTLQMQEAEVRHQLASVADRLRDEFQLEIDEVLAEGLSARAAIRQSPSVDGEPGERHEAAAEAQAGDEVDPAVERQQIEEQINRLRRKIKQLGHVNADSLKELDELESRFARLSGQLQDLLEAKSSLEEIIRRINSESRRIFLDCFNEIRKNFQELFRKLFGGGEGDVILENPDDVLECGIDVVARPPGKELRSLTLLSGGEKTMAAVALLLAIFKSKPSPFCILDEVDAALDEGNVNRYLNVIREFQEWTQFIVVTHNKRTMSGADVLYGVTMEEAGISKRMSVRFEDISEDGNFKVAA
ncbi:MAG TPA: chromosome segregation protein SMC [Planctomycetaceae bacterium]|nr:chromosome segregation protein SMC [Planctomycetaceae bacterium]